MNAYQRILDQRSRYVVRFELGLALALLIVVMAFQVRWSAEEDFNVRLEKQEVVHVEEVRQTTQSEKAPAPPAPSVTVEVPNNRVLEQEEVNFDASLDLNDALDTGQDSMGTSPSEGYVDSDPDEKEDEEEIFVAVERRPDCGGVEAIQERLTYPKIAREAGLKGTVFVQFVVTDDGEVIRPTVTKGVHPMLDDAAVEAVKSLDCTPGQQRNKRVNVRMTLPVRFELQEN